MIKNERYNSELVKFEEIKTFFRSNLSELKNKTNIDYSTTYSYAENWGVTEVIRELISNGLDTGCFGSITVDIDRKLVLICDSGEGLKLRNLLLGNSEKSSNNPIGKFGEGLKLACLVMQRQALSIEINTNRYCIKPSSYFVEDIACFRMVAYEKSNKTNGTQILMEFSDIKDVYNALDLFLTFQSSKVIANSDFGAVLQSENEATFAYIRGVKVEQIDALFSYNIYDNELNRDRNVISEYELRRQITRILNRTQSDAIVKAKLIANVTNSLTFENKLYLHIYDAKDGFKNAYGKSAILLTTPILYEQMIYRRKIPIRHDGNWTLHGVLTDVAIAHAESKSLASVKTYKYRNNKFTLEQKKNLSIAVKLANKVIYPEVPLNEFKNYFRFFDNLSVKQEEEEDTNGYCKGRLIFIAFQALINLEETINTIFHEATHLKTGFPDGASFSILLGCYLAKAIVYLHQTYVKRL